MENERAQELSLDDLEHVAGGFTFESDSALNGWLQGYHVRCPHCGNDKSDSIHQGATVGREITYFICNKCGKPFQCRIAKKDYNSRTGEWVFDIATDPSPASDIKF